MLEANLKILSINISRIVQLYVVKSNHSLSLSSFGISGFSIDTGKCTFLEFGWYVHARTNNPTQELMNGH